MKFYQLMGQYIAGSRTGKRSRTGERYFEEFRSRFWERPTSILWTLITDEVCQI